MQTRRFVLLGSGAAGLALIAGCSTLGTRSSIPGQVVTMDAIERVNAFRVANGRTPLRHDARASEAALSHARTMAENRRMAHNIGVGADFVQRMKGQNVTLPAAENIATGQATVDRALLAWEVSASHRANTLDPRFTGLGVAMAQDTGNGGAPYWAMILSGG